MAASGSGLKIALGLSVAANLFFLGLMAGSLFDSKPERRDAAPSSFMKSLDPARAEELRGFFTAGGDERRAWRKMRQGAWEKAYQAMATDPFDREAFDAALVDLRGAADARKAARFERLGDFAASLTAEERAAFAQSMIDRRKKRQARREKRDKN